jgi:hypothetical protein
MSSGLTHTGAIARGLAYAPAPPRRSWTEVAAARLEAANVTAAKPVQPTPNAGEAREQIREQVMAERGVDLLDLYRMGSQQRIRTEAAIMAEMALRAAQSRARQTAQFVDLRV